jgi:hypothetical protein
MVGLYISIVRISLLRIHGRLTTVMLAFAEHLFPSFRLYRPPHMPHSLSSPFSSFSSSSLTPTPFFYLLLPLARCFTAKPILCSLAGRLTVSRESVKTVSYTKEGKGRTSTTSPLLQGLDVKGVSYTKRYKKEMKSRT